MFNYYPKTAEVETKIEKIITDVSTAHKNNKTIDHINKYPLPSKDMIISIINDFFDILFPGYFTQKEINSINLHHFIGHKINNVFEKLINGLTRSYTHMHYVEQKECCNLCGDCLDKSIDAAIYLLENLPEIQRLLSKDVQAAYDGDPAAKSIHEVIFSYPGLYAITIHRLAHLLYVKQIPLFPRIMSEYAHSITGIDIHPGAQIGEYFFIDHGTGVVIGETSIIGNNVKFYQGVTLGALSIPKDEKGNAIKGLQRHPTIEDNVTIYSGTTILGGKTIIGKNSIIGGNLWIVSSIPADSKVVSTKTSTQFDIIHNH
ncbi:MAG: serine acetyltransferase [Spirochaetes bacterium]|nr:serine acetyltransferase [Spirochaetota bacterium]